MTVEVRQMVVRSTITRDADPPPEAARDEAPSRMMMDELLDECRRLVDQLSRRSKER